MNSQSIREKILQLLFEENFKVARKYRKTMEALPDLPLQQYFQNLASRHSQFALELADEIAYYGGKKPFSPSGAFENRRVDLPKKSKRQLLKKALKCNKLSLLKYREALCHVNDGSCREILLRHKAFVENSVFELKALKRLMKSPLENNKEKSTIS
jgi:hypothetical protein